jgi:hypothetical protein
MCRNMCVLKLRAIYIIFFNDAQIVKIHLGLDESAYPGLGF